MVFAGLPGSGKSVPARGVADAIGATYLRIDTIESAIVSALMPFRDNPVGYVVAERAAADQLVAGRDVVADAVNGVGAARARWVALAARTGAALQFVEVRCSDVAEHRRRVEGREPEMPGQGVPTWDAGASAPLRVVAAGAVWPGSSWGQRGRPGGTHLRTLYRTVAAEAGQDRRQRLEVTWCRAGPDDRRHPAPVALMLLTLVR